MSTDISKLTVTFLTVIAVTQMKINHRSSTAVKRKKSFERKNSFEIL